MTDHIYLTESARLNDEQQRVLVAFLKKNAGEIQRRKETELEDGTRTDPQIPRRSEVKLLRCGWIGADTAGRPVRCARSRTLLTSSPRRRRSPLTLAKVKPASDTA